MTYKSTRDILKEAVADSRLKQFIPTLLPGQAIRRGLYATVGFSNWLNDKPSNAKDIEYMAQVHATLGRFAKGDKIDNKHYMKRLEAGSNEVWAIRIFLQPKVRIFGAFALPDCFICTNLRTRKELHDFGSPEWESAKKRSREIWTTLFGGMKRITGTHFSHYVSNGDHFDWPHR